MENPDSQMKDLYETAPETLSGSPRPGNSATELVAGADPDAENLALFADTYGLPVYI
jgi:hypothetical protein